MYDQAKSAWLCSEASPPANADKLYLMQGSRKSEGRQDVLQRDSQGMGAIFHAIPRRLECRVC